MTTDSMPFSVVSEHDATGAQLRLHGQVDRDAESALLEAFDAAADEGQSRVVLDLSSTTYINSSGLASIVALLSHAKAKRVTVAARGLTAHYRHIFEITRLSDLIELEPEEGGT